MQCLFYNMFYPAERKAQVSFSDQNLSVVRRCRRRLQTTGPISTKHSTKHPWVKGIQVCSNEGTHKGR